jgi:hypothetical protein
VVKQKRKARVGFNCTALAKGPLFAAVTLYGSGSDFDGILRAPKSASFLQNFRCRTLVKQNFESTATLLTSGIRRL